MRGQETVRRANSYYTFVWYLKQGVLKLKGRGSLSSTLIILGY